MRSSYKPQALLGLITTAALAPFLNKAFHIDDPLFLWMAQQIAKHPLDPYGFDVNWSSFIQPMSAVMQNPPLCSYFIASIASIVGWSEIALHAAFIGVAIAAVLGTFALARRFCGNPIAAAMLTLFTPVFLVSATNVMCDVMLVAFWVWAIECWLAGLEQGKLRSLALASVLASAAMLTKYFGITVVPLLAVYTILRRPRSWWYLAFLVLPILLALLYDMLTRTAYGHGMFGGAISYVVADFGRKESLLTRVVIGLIFVGGCLFGAICFVPIGNWRFLSVASSLLLLAVFSFHAFIRVPSEAAANHTVIWAEGALFVTVGVLILALGVVDLTRQRSADSLLLLLWIIGTYVFVTFFNWAITARTILPMAPAVAILLVRQFKTQKLSPRLSWTAVALAAAVSFFVAAADVRLANSGREASRQFRKDFAAEHGVVWFYGHWGFQYYMEQWGAKPIATDSRVFPNDVLIIAESYPADAALPKPKIIAAKRLPFSTVPWLSTFNRLAGAGFYLHAVGPLPWTIARVPPEYYYVARLQ